MLASRRSPSPSVGLRRAAAVLLAALWTASAEAAVKPHGSPAADDALLFPTPAIVRKQVRFWEKVFHRYPSTTVIVHETGDPDRIIDIIDYKAFAKRDAKNQPVPRKERDAVTRKYLARYSKAIERFQRFKADAVQFGPIEKRVFHVYRNSPAALAKLYAGDIKLRAQTGLADDFLGAAGIAQAYLPYMERVFQAQGVPTRLTRIAFVESMFNLKARSKVGASGLWQFMPKTAKQFVFVNALVDERNSPYKATRAAAQYLGLNYQELKSWPLAITAYNHGRGGMQRAVKMLGTDDIGEIIQRYESPSFGFASKNFYAEFIAAANTYDRLERARKIKRTHVIPDLEPVVLEKPISVSELLKATPLTKELLAEHNPCLLETSFTVNAQKPLPAYYQIKVPRGLVQATKAALIEMKEKRYARR